MKLTTKKLVHSDCVLPSPDEIPNTLFYVFGGENEKVRYQKKLHCNERPRYVPNDPEVSRWGSSTCAATPAWSGTWSRKARLVLRWQGDILPLKPCPVETSFPTRSLFTLDAETSRGHWLLFDVSGPLVLPLSKIGDLCMGIRSLRFGEREE